MTRINRLVMLLTLVASSAATALEALKDQDLGQVSGKSLGLVLENLAVHSKDRAASDAFSLRLDLTDQQSPDALLLSELRLHKSGTVSGSPNSGGRLGSYTDPLIMGQLKTLTETHKGMIDANGDGNLALGSRQFSALYTALPSASETQMPMDFYQYSQNPSRALTVSSRAEQGGTAGVVYSRGLPNDFFSAKSEVNVGNFYAIAEQYQRERDNQIRRLQQSADAFDLHLRIDDLSGNKRNQSPDQQFLASVDVKGLRFYGTKMWLWSHNSQGEQNPFDSNKFLNNGAPSYANRGLSMASTLGIIADSIKIQTQPHRINAEQSVLELKGVNAYLPFGTADQPLNISQVKYAQVKRGQWALATPERLPAKHQLRIELAGLPQDVKRAPGGHVFVRSLHFGGENNDEVTVGYKDVHIRDKQGRIVHTYKNVAHKAFVPETVTYNEQVARYQAQNNNPNVSYVPNQNVIQIRGMEIQRLVITTQDL